MGGRLAKKNTSQAPTQCTHTCIHPHAAIHKRPLAAPPMHPQAPFLDSPIHTCTHIAALACIYCPIPMTASLRLVASLAPLLLRWALSSPLRLL